MGKKGAQVSTIENLYFIGFIFIIGLGGLIVSQDFSQRARILPQIVSGLLISLAIIEIWNSWKFMQKQDKQIDKNEATKLRINVLSGTILAILVYPAFLYFLGFIVSSMIIIAFLMYMREIRSIVKIGIFSVLTPSLVYILFNTLAGVKLPEGPWGF